MRPVQLTRAPRLRQELVSQSCVLLNLTRLATVLRTCRSSVRARALGLALVPDGAVGLGGPGRPVVVKWGASWALGWHRIWVADWFTAQIERGWAKGAEDTWATAITRHLTEAASLLRA